MRKKILVTGGAGYIGSHIIITLLQAQYDVVLVDNFSNSKPERLDHIKLVAKRKCDVIVGDISDEKLITNIFERHCFYAVIHLAGKKSVSESIQYPLKYYDNNVKSTIVLLNAMKKSKCRKFIFSSSAAVYGNNGNKFIKEDNQTIPTNPYGKTKLIIEDMLNDLKASDETWCISILRYFNAVAAHESGLLAENHEDAPSNLFPSIARVIQGKSKELYIYGGNNSALDGTCVRDYIHVVDLARAHLECLQRIEGIGFEILNIGTGVGYSVLEVVSCFEKMLCRSIPKKTLYPREGDVAECVADVKKTKDVLGFSAQLTLMDMCKDTINTLSLESTAL